MAKKESPRALPGNVNFGERISTGNDDLDEILSGGLPTNHIYLLEGEPGTGKTTLALEFLLEGVRNGESVLYITLSETKEELLSVARSHGWSLDGINIYELVPSGDSLKLESQYTIFHPSEVELSETTNAILEEVERTQPKRVVFDSLSEMRLLARESLRYRRQILALKQYFAPRDCTVLLIDDKTSGGDDLQIHSIVHGILVLEHLAVEFGGARRRLRVSKLRGSTFSGGYHDFNIETGGLKVFPRLTASDYYNEFARGSLESGLKELDTIMGGGLDRGTSSLLIGPAGSGKSSIAAQFAVCAADKGENAAIFVFDETRENYIARAVGIGMKIQKHLDGGAITIQQVDPAELAPGEFASAVINAVTHNHANVVVIDSLNGYLNAMPEERFLTIQMHELLTYLNKQGIVTILVMAQHGFLGQSMSAPIDVSYLADTVIMLRYFETFGRVRRALSVVKKRTGEHESTIREIQITSDGITVGEPLTEFQGVLTGVPSYIGRLEDLMGLNEK